MVSLDNPFRSDSFGNTTAWPPNMAISFKAVSGPTAARTSVTAADGSDFHCQYASVYAKSSLGPEITSNVDLIAIVKELHRHDLRVTKQYLEQGQSPDPDHIHSRRDRDSILLNSA